MLPVRISGSEAKRFNNQIRYCTFALKMSLNGNFYALTAHFVVDTICGCIEAVRDCCVLQSRALDDSYEVPNTNDIIETINESDEDEAGEHRGKNGYDTNNADM